MSERAVKNRKRYVDHTKDRPKISCLVHGPRHSSDECKILGDFGSKYSKIMPTKYRVDYPTTKKKFSIHQDNNAIVQHEVHYIILQENNEVMCKMKNMKTPIL